jgi:hypothetical protein
VLTPDFTPTQPGTSTLTAAGIVPLGGLAPASMTFRVVAAGGTKNDSLRNDPPAVITARTVPKANATGVSVGIAPQVVFTEPVRHVTPDTVILTDASGARVAATLAGTGPDGPIETLSDTSVITSLTIQPRTALPYATRYTLTLTAGILDRDVDPTTQQPAPKALIPYTTSFTTFGRKPSGRPGNHRRDCRPAAGRPRVGPRRMV